MLAAASMPSWSIYFGLIVSVILAVPVVGGIVTYLYKSITTLSTLRKTSDTLVKLPERIDSLQAELSRRLDTQDAALADLERKVEEKHQANSADIEEVRRLLYGHEHVDSGVVIKHGTVT